MVVFHIKKDGRLTAEDKKEIDWAMEVTGTGYIPTPLNQ